MAISFEHYSTCFHCFITTTTTAATISSSLSITAVIIIIANSSPFMHVKCSTRNAIT
ncbi:unnamed protein product [Musa textilis]